MKEKIIKALARLKPLLKPFGIKAGISLVVSAIIALVGVVLVCGAFVTGPWLSATAVIFCIAVASSVISWLLTKLPSALNKVLNTIYSFAIVCAVFSLLLYALVCSGFDFSDMNTYTEKTKRRITNYINTSYRTATLSEAAEMLDLSTAHLSRWIKKEFGSTFKEMLCQKRFEVACDMLVNTKLSVNDIILNVGYENSSYFHKQFKSRFGVTPKDYRK